MKEVRISMERAKEIAAELLNGEEVHIREKLTDRYGWGSAPLVISVLAEVCPRCGAGCTKEEITNCHDGCLQLTGECCISGGYRSDLPEGGCIDCGKIMDAGYEYLEALEKVVGYGNMQHKPDELVYLEGELVAEGDGTVSCGVCLKAESQDKHCSWHGGEYQIRVGPGRKHGT